MPRYWNLERYAGKYVAVDMKTDEVVLSTDTPHQLDADIRAKGVRNVMVMRAPADDEPLLVGPG